ncbi:hypothetical protein F4821DRAFT_9361 [Hypoxylon rubiginosum]|uniref:Uncharacterized protein n=1 Tax=Hypoxylon rubiginosum TaxID=110542 RepID=A0ACC0DME6_9PEZI|nr:hypothetical protein F4821DRAFT_9361 [Hypoxylon rubiginosum]
MNASLGRILGSGPSNVSVDNFAERLDRVTRSVCSHYNRDKGHDDQTRQRHALVVRGYNPREEMNAAARMLKDPEGLTATDSEWAVGSWWKPHLSLAFWALTIIRSPAKSVRQLNPDDKTELLALKADIDADHKWGDLRALIAGQTEWDAYESKNDPKGQLKILFVKLLSLADILCVTPSGSENDKDYREWKNREAKGIAVDEAANTNRADLYCVWGNTLLPCFLAGDPKQLPPAVLSAGVTDAEGNLFHRHVKDAKISALVFYQASGVPTYLPPSRLAHEGHLSVVELDGIEILT